MQLTTVTSKGQVTIPVDIRRHLGLKTGDSVQFVPTNGEFRLKPVPNFFSFRGSLKSKKPLNMKLIRQAIGKHLAQRYLKTFS
ncbi:MAG: hypothetical protein A2784_01365 [Candidatus Chisholmbacteria bacterium RIFCSPHIGHO2_01_FULL_48_12]|uniref:SpoVT-AbrB domain-containing protein n=1 Tax=Candidatus Chisholmbacteria bacterium RIFCSPHIGHO2_01_FULL_48_12 TaxID=1797589 RepID=A0A1G1VQ71_9BACT|nr:MAG: hypothetical protein A2784_01365 [Candidatus Chisholmbacteria bacterium RIFCSPHIGHO2_01_FULL_48_12]